MTVMNDLIWWTYLITAAAVFALWLFFHLIGRLNAGQAGSYSLGSLIVGKDGGLSTSKFQAVLWTMILIISYIAVYTAHAVKGTYNPTISIPTNLLILAGLGTATFIGAAKITESQVRGDLESKTQVDLPPNAEVRKVTSQTGNPGDLINDDAENADIGKFQMLSWNLIAAAIFLLNMHYSLTSFLSGTAPALDSFPDIDTTLLALAGIGQAGYLAKKGLIDKPQAHENQPLPTTQMVARAQGVRAPIAAGGLADTAGAQTTNAVLPLPPGSISTASGAGASAQAAPDMTGGAGPRSEG